jgi:hypothetical protein
MTAPSPFRRAYIRSVIDQVQVDARKSALSAARPSSKGWSCWYKGTMRVIVGESSTLTPNGGACGC